MDGAPCILLKMLEEKTARFALAAREVIRNRRPLPDGRGSVKRRVKPVLQTAGMTGNVNHRLPHLQRRWATLRVLIIETPPIAARWMGHPARGS